MNQRPHLLRLRTCPRCRYDIASLPRRHRCPECGFVYDERMFMLEGWRLPDGRRWLRALIVWGPIGVLLLIVLRVELGVPLPPVLLVGTVLAALTGLLYLRASRYRDPVLRRYLITEDGVARPGRGIYLWRNYSHVMLLEDGPGAWRIHLYPAWWRLVAGPPVVNARLECSDREAEVVRDEIQSRINRARRAEAGQRSPKGPPRRWW